MFIRLRKRNIRIPIASRLILSFVIIILFSSSVFTLVGIRVISDRIVAEAQERVRTDLNSAREIYLNEQNKVFNFVRLTADRYLIKNSLLTGDLEPAIKELVRVKLNEGVDILNVTDKNGYLLIRSNHPEDDGADCSWNELVTRVLKTKEPLQATVIVPGDELQKESPFLAQKAYFAFIDTPKARHRLEKEERSGMMMMAAAPILDDQNNLLGVLYGGILLNRNYEIVDKIKKTVFQGVTYQGKDIGTSTLFLDDVRIATNVENLDGSRAVGTRLAEDVYNQVILEGKPWIGRAFVVKDWYITAYEPIRDINNKIIGILYVGILEKKYLDIKNQTILTFSAITLPVIVVSVMLAYVIYQSILEPIKKLVNASNELAHGNLEVRIEKITNDELGDLSDTFNYMVAALKDRDERLKEFTRTKLMESERLALIGQLSANIAHELNNPLQGILTYSHLLAERDAFVDETCRQNVQKIIVQTNRCRDIIRGLLDFARQKKPDKILTDINSLLEESVSLVENQALFHNVHITMNLDPNLPMIVVDPAQIERVFINLIVNAAEAMDGNGQLKLITRFDPANDRVEIECSDTGCGISKENLEKIFDPFFTTKEVGHGVGLGLAISYGIIKEHNGTISVESEVGKGTTFTIRLPLKIATNNNGNGR